MKSFNADDKQANIVALTPVDPDHKDIYLIYLLPCVTLCISKSEYPMQVYKKQKPNHK